MNSFQIFLLINIVTSTQIHCLEFDFNSDKIDYTVKITSQTDQAVIEKESIVLYCDVRTVIGNLAPLNPGKIQYRWLFNGVNLVQEPRKHSNNNQLIILKTDYQSDFGEYKCIAFLPPSNYPFESAPYSLNIHWISKKAQIVYFKYPEQDEDVDLPLQSLPIDLINQFKTPFKVGLKCQAFGYPELQFDWFLNGETIVAPNVRLSGSKYSLEQNNLYIIGQDPSVNGVYTCSARNSVGNLNSQNNFLIKVKSKRQTLELKSITSDLIVNQGQTIVLNCEFANYDRIQWYAPNGNLIVNSTRTLISTNNSVLIMHPADKQLDEGNFKCIAYRIDKRQPYSIRVQFAFIDEFSPFSILALYNQNYKTNNNVIIVPEHSKFELVCLTPNGRPEAKIYWINSQNKVISNQGTIRILDNNQLLLQNAQLDQSGVYKCVAENIAAKKIKQFTIKVQKMPLIANSDIQLEQTTKEQTNFTLNCLEKETDNLNNYFFIQWFHNGSLISPTDKRKSVNKFGQLLISHIHSSDEGLYVCKLNHTGYPMRYNAGINLKVIELLKFIQLPVDRRLELNRPAKVHCRARTSIDPLDLKIRWIKGDADLLLKSLQLTNQQQDQQHLNLNLELLNNLKELIKINQLPENDTLSNGTNIKDENGYLIIKQMSKQEEGFYTCLAFTNQELIYTTIRLDAVIMPKFQKTPPEHLIKLVKENLQLDCIATADPKPSIKWDKDNDQNLISNNPRIQTFENGSLVILNLTEEDQGKFSCLVGNSGGFIRAESYLTVKKSNGLKIELIDTIDEASFNSRIQKTVAIALGIAFLYILVIVGLLVWFRYKRIADRRLLQNEILQEGISSLSSNKSTGNSSNASSNQGTKSNSLEKCTLINEQLELKSTYHLFNEDVQKTSTYLIDDYDYKNQISLDTNSLNSRSPVDSSFNRKNLQQIMLLGNGEFGNVFLAKCIFSLNNSNDSDNSNNLKNQEIMVMVKSLQSQDPLIMNEFNEEIEIFKKLSHNHITRLIAVCFDQEPRLFLLEYTDYGDLKQYLLATRLECQSNLTIKPEPLTKVQLLKIAIQITDALSYLTNEQFCVHKDIATRNCLISSNLDIKVTLCSLSNDTYSKEYIKFRNRNLPLRWCAHEALFDNKFDKYSDVWSFAVLFWELLFAAELPFNDLKDEQVFNLLKCKQLKLNFDEFDWFSNHLCTLLKQCLNYQPTERPSFKSLHTTLINELNFISC